MCAQFRIVKHKKRKSPSDRTESPIDGILLHKRTSSIYALLATVSALVTVALAVLQYLSAERSGDEAKAQAQAMSEIADKMSSSLALSVDQSRVALESTIAASRNEQRAWMMPSKISLVAPLNSVDAPRISIEYGNSGKSPSTAVSYAASMIRKELRL